MAPISNITHENSSCANKWHRMNDSNKCLKITLSLIYDEDEKHNAHDTYFEKKKTTPLHFLRDTRWLPLPKVLRSVDDFISLINNPLLSFIDFLKRPTISPHLTKFLAMTSWLELPYPQTVFHTFRFSLHFQQSSPIKFLLYYKIKNCVKHVKTVRTFRLVFLNLIF